MLKPNQRAYLRKLAQTMSPIFQVGKNGISDNQIEQLINALEGKANKKELFCYVPTVYTVKLGEIKDLKLNYIFFRHN